MSKDTVKAQDVQESLKEAVLGFGRSGPGMVDTVDLSDIISLAGIKGKITSVKPEVIEKFLNDRKVVDKKRAKQLAGLLARRVNVSVSTLAVSMMAKVLRQEKIKID